MIACGWCGIEIPPGAPSRPRRFCSLSCAAKDKKRRGLSGRKKQYCSVACCERPCCGGGYCELHWRRVRDHGDPMKGAFVPGVGYKTTESSFGRRTYEHIAIVERAIGRKLPRGAQVHHVNGDKRDNRHSNLVACQDAAYHKMLHRRQRALKECGNPSWLKCRQCRQYDEPARIERGERGQLRHIDAGARCLLATR